MLGPLFTASHCGAALDISGHARSSWLPGCRYSIVLSQDQSLLALFRVLSRIWIYTFLSTAPHPHHLRGEMVTTEEGEDVLTSPWRLGGGE